MIEDVIFTINTVMPVFFTITVGYFIKSKRIITDNGAKELNRLIFNVMLPMLLFSNIAFADISEIYDTKLVTYISIASILTFLLSWLYAEFFIKDKTLIGTFVQGSYRGNYALLSLVLILNVLGEKEMARASMVAPFIMPIYNAFSIIILSIRGKSSAEIDRQSLKATFVNICKNPLIISIVLAVPFSVLKIKLPDLLENSIKYIGSATSPIALISIGASFNISKVSKNISESVVAVLIKLIISPILFMYTGYVLGFSNVDVVIIGLILGSPTAVSSYIMAASLDGDVDLAANILVITTLLSVVTLTGFIAFAKFNGLI